MKAGAAIIIPWLSAFSLQVDIQQTVELLTHQFVNLRYN